MAGHDPDQTGPESPQWSSLLHVYYAQGWPYCDRRQRNAVSLKNKMADQTGLILNILILLFSRNLEAGS